MKASFVKLSPSENTTIIITDPAVKQRDYSKIAKAAMAYTHLYGEQVGFLTQKHSGRAKGRMEMSGGEFCGNGLLSLGAYLAWTEGIEKDVFLLEFSGATKPLTCEVEKISHEKYRVKGEMPVEGYRISKKEVKAGEKSVSGDLVEMEGITHFLFQNPEKENFKGDYPDLLKNLWKDGNNEAYGALGYRITNDSIRLSPWVFVPGIDSLREERSCGSGSLALGLLWAEEKEESVRIEIKQPGGMIAVKIDYDGRAKKVTAASIETEVMITCEGNLLF